MDDDVKELLRRAKMPEREPDPRPRRDNRYVYSGEPPRVQTAEAPKQNKKVVKRRVSTFNSILFLFGGGIAIVLYVNHIITIGRLAAEVGQLQARYEQVQNTNAALKAEVNRKSAWERIGKTATEQLGLTFPKEQPVLLTVDQDALARAKKQ